VEELPCRVPAGNGKEVAKRQGLALVVDEVWCGYGHRTHPEIVNVSAK
jgi:hypothetical protein